MQQKFVKQQNFNIISIDETQIKRLSTQHTHGITHPVFNVKVSFKNRPGDTKLCLYTAQYVQGNRIVNCFISRCDINNNSFQMCISETIKCLKARNDNNMYCLWLNNSSVHKYVISLCEKEEIHTCLLTSQNSKNNSVECYFRVLKLKYKDLTNENINLTEKINYIFNNFQLQDHRTALKFYQNENKDLLYEQIEEILI